MHVLVEMLLVQIYLDAICSRCSCLLFAFPLRTRSENISSRWAKMDRCSCRIFIQILGRKHRHSYTLYRHIFFFPRAMQLKPLQCK
jgi:hypothetical protein